ncbi:MAG: hypothetical protein OD816_000310 [Thermodesulfobacterium sp.]|uniref:Uncharacterized protein n=1 Tax=Candidatus Thermodesulfobacterium syntrophicum TaxID=3060442 RepID=A0AAE3P371_9BACT|nr:hypothetical protein [Candidatus Thermodesulfobacterium syntrophicum]
MSYDCSNDETKKEIFIDEVKIIDAEGYMKLALDADINMFI